MKPTDAGSHIPENGMSTTPRTDAAYFKQGATMYDLAGESKKLETELYVMQFEFGRMVLFAAVMGDRNVELRIRAEKAEAELKIEREKVRVLRDAITRLQGYCEWVIPPHDRICAIVRVALAATKEASK